MERILDIKYNEHEFLDLHLPENPKGIFVYFHGGALRKGSKNPKQIFIRDLLESSIAVVDVNYRMYPSAKFPDFIEDAADAVSWTFNNIKSYCDCDKIFVGGSSAGGYLSMMLCFDEQYLAKRSLKPTDITGFIHDSGQPTSHYKVLAENNIDQRRLIVDHRAPLYFVGANGSDCTDMLFLVADHDMQNRYEQTLLMLSTLNHFGYDQQKIKFKLLNGTHCEHVTKADENGKSVFAQIILDFILSVVQ